MLKKISYVVLFFILTTSCGYKKINQDEIMIHIQNISVEGDKRTAFKLKNNILLISNKNANDKYDLELTIEDNKTSKIKNSAGRITRYNKKITVNLTLKGVSQEKSIKKLFSKSGDFEVEKVHTDTIANERNVSENIVKQLSDQITNFIIFFARN
jgi:hypothetical protein